MAIKIDDVREEAEAIERVLKFLAVRDRENKIFAEVERQAQIGDPLDPAGPTAAHALAALLHRLRRAEERIRVLEGDFPKKESVF